MSEYEDSCYDYLEICENCFVKNDEMMERDFNDSIDINHDFGNGQSYLSTACKNLYKFGIQFLLSKGANMHMKDNGHDPIYYVIESYNNLIYDLNVQCDYRFLNEFVNILRQKIDQNLITDDQLTETIETNNLFTGLLYRLEFLGKNVAIDIIKSIIKRDFNHRISLYDDILDIFVEAGYNLENKDLIKSEINTSGMMFVRSLDIDYLYGFFLIYPRLKDVNIEMFKSFDEFTKSKIQRLLDFGEYYFEFMEMLEPEYHMIHY